MTKYEFLSWSVQIPGRRFLLVLACVTAVITAFAQSQRDTLIAFKDDSLSLWGYKNGNGEIVIQPKFAYASRFKNNYATVDGPQGTRWRKTYVINRKGERVTPMGEGRYEILDGKPPFFVFQDHIVSGRQVLYDTTGKEIYSCNGCYISRFIRDSVFVATPGSYGTKDSTVLVFNAQGKVLYTHMGHGLTHITDYYDPTGGMRTHASPLYFLTIRDRTLLGATGNKGMVLRGDFSVAFDSVRGIPHFYRGKGIINTAYGSVFTDTLLRPIIPFSAGYSNMFYWGNAGCISAMKDSLYGILDTSGNVILPCIYNAPLNPQRNGFAFRLYCTSCLPGRKSQDIYLLRNGDTLISNDYWMESQNGIGQLDFSGPITIKNKKTDKYGIITYDSSLIVPCRYSCLGELHNGRIVFFRGDTAGYLDAQGKEKLILPFKCNGLSDFSNGRALCSIWVPGGRMEYPTAQIITMGNRDYARRLAWIDTTGKIMGGTYDWVSRFRDGWCLVMNKGETFMIDTTCQRVRLNGQYDYISFFKNGYAVISDGRNVGLADSLGNIVIPVEYDEIAMKEDGPGGVHFLDKAGHADSTYTSFVVPDIIDGKIRVKRGRKEEEIQLGK